MGSLMVDHLRIARRRLAEVEAETQRLTDALRAVASERDELLTAVRVMERLAGGAGADADESDAEPSPSHDGEDALPVGGQAMTVMEMTVEILKGASKPLLPREIADLIRERWKPDLRGSAINNTVYRMKQRGEVDALDDGRYRWPLTDAGGHLTSGRAGDADDDLLGRVSAPPDTNPQAPSDDGKEVAHDALHNSAVA